MNYKQLYNMIKNNPKYKDLATFLYNHCVDEEGILYVYENVEEFIYMFILDEKEQEILINQLDDLEYKLCLLENR